MGLVKMSLVMGFATLLFISNIASALWKKCRVTVGAR
jgi:hypothetical protein